MAHDKLDATSFMAGVALFDDFLREAARHEWNPSVLLEGAMREGRPLHLYALPAIEALLRRPGALGEWAWGALYSGTPALVR